MTLVAAMAFAAALQAALVGMQGTLGMRLATKISIVLQSRMVARLLQLPAQFHAVRGSAAMAQRAVQPGNVANDVAHILRGGDGATVAQHQNVGIDPFGGFKHRSSAPDSLVQ